MSMHMDSTFIYSASKGPNLVFIPEFLPGAPFTNMVQL